MSYSKNVRLPNIKISVQLRDGCYRCVSVVCVCVCVSQVLSEKVPAEPHLERSRTQFQPTHIH